MISEPINTYRTLKRTLANRVDQNQKQKSVESDHGRYYLLKIPDDGNNSIDGWLW